MSPGVLTCRRTAATIIAAAGAAAAMFATAACGGSGKDSELVVRLNGLHVPVGDSAYAVSEAHAVCNGFDRGEDAKAIAQKVVADNSYSDYIQGVSFVQAAVQEYCFKYSNRLQF